jgi:hypothetical protein
MTRHPIRSRVTVAGLALAAALTSAACGSSAVSSAPGAPTDATKAATDLRGERYCEVLLVHAAPAGLTADVYNSYPMNACPQSEWAALNARQIAQENQVLLANLNGPRYWLMDRIDKSVGTSGPTKDFDGIVMTQRATVLVGDPATAQQPYLLHEVDRRTAFSFEKGSTVYELTDPQDRKWVMQSWSQEVNPTLDEAELADLTPKLQLPAGWSYASRTLRAPPDLDARCAGQGHHRRPQEHLLARGRGLRRGSGRPERHAARGPQTVQRASRRSANARGPSSWSG